MGVSRQEAALMSPRGLLMMEQQEHLHGQMKRLQEQLDKDKQERQIERLICSDRFVDSLASRIAERMGVSEFNAIQGGGGLPGGGAQHTAGGTGGFGQTTRGSGGFGSTNRSFGGGGGGGGGGRTANHHLSMGITKPEPPAFIDDEDHAHFDRNVLPVALQGYKSDPAAEQAVRVQGSSAAKATAVTVSDVEEITQEKTRGESYVRLLIQPEAHAAAKETKPYRPQLLEPDSKLLTAVPYRTAVPPKQTRYDEATGEVLEEDEFEDVEKSNVIIFSFIRHNRYEAVEQLLAQEPAILETVDQNGNTLLHVACQNNNRRVAKLLIRTRADINAQNTKGGNTPLHYAYAYGYSQLCEFLISRGADDVRRNNDGLLPSQGLGKEETPESGATKHLMAIRDDGQ